MNINLTQYRNRAARQGVRAFSAPYLPERMITAVLLLIAVHAVLVLANQNMQYWFYYKLAESSLPFIQSLLSVHPLAFFGAVLAYMVAVWLILQIFNRSLALIAWSGLAFLHISQIFALLDKMTGIFTGENSGVMALLQASLGGLVVGLLLATLLLRPVKERAPKVAAAEPVKPRTRPWFLNWKVEVGAILVVAAVGALAYFIMMPKAGWKPVRVSVSPGPRCCAAIAYDSRRERAVLFGGATQWLGANNDQVGDTWEWDSRSGAWIKIEALGAPTARSQAVMAYDEARGRIVMFGGRNKDFFYNETWEYDGQQWIQLSLLPQGGDSTPAGRTDHQLIYDPTRQKVILFGGYAGKDANGNNIFTNDVWEWDGQTWKRISENLAQPTVVAMSAAWDASQDRLVTMNYDHPLVWNETSWMIPNWTNTPPGRKNAAMAALPGGGLMLFGGYLEEVRTDETWLLHDLTWEQFKSPVHPSSRAFPIMFTDPIRGRVYLYGGQGDSLQYFSDMWEFRAP